MQTLPSVDTDGAELRLCRCPDRSPRATPHPRSERGTLESVVAMLMIIDAAIGAVWAPDTPLENGSLRRAADCQRMSGRAGIGHRQLALGRPLDASPATADMPVEETFTFTTSEEFGTYFEADAAFNACTGEVLPTIMVDSTAFNHYAHPNNYVSAHGTRAVNADDQMGYSLRGVDWVVFDYVQRELQLGRQRHMDRTRRRTVQGAHGAD